MHASVGVVGNVLTLNMCGYPCHEPCWPWWSSASLVPNALQ
jgi:hypothetical protein